MKNILLDIAGGIVIILVAALAGLAHNAVRARSITLIQHVGSSPAGAEVSDSSSTGTGEAAFEEILREGSVTADQVRVLLGNSSVVVIDARSPQEFEEGHISGAINIPYDQLPEYYGQLIQDVPMDALVVCYCQGPACDFSDQLTTELRIIGFPKVVIFPGGWEHWQAAGYPSEGTMVNE